MTGPTEGYIEHQFGAKLQQYDIMVMTITALACGVIGSLYGSVVALLEGYGRIIIKNYVTIFSSITAGLLSWPLISTWGVKGFCAVNLTLVGSQLILSFGILALQEYGKFNISLSETVRIIQEIWKATLAFSIMGVLRLTFEPVTKLLMSTGDSLPALASFDLALRISTNARGLIQSAIQPLLYVGSRKVNVLEGHVKHLYSVSNIRTYRLSILFAAGQLACAPILSELGFGTADNGFIVFICCLICANTLNTFGIVGYYFQVSSGVMYPLVVIHFMMLVINIGVGILGRIFFGPIGIVFGYCLTFAFGGLASLKLYLDHEHIGLLRFFIQHGNAAAWGMASICLILSLQAQAIAKFGGNQFAIVVSLIISSLVAVAVVREMLAIRKAMAEGQ